jgi:hypothetical protein
MRLVRWFAADLGVADLRPSWSGLAALLVFFGFIAAVWLGMVEAA